MKKFLNLAIVAILSVFTLIVASACHQHNDVDTSYFGIEDSTAIADIVKSVNNPTFTQPSEFVNHVVALQQEKKIDDILMSLSPQTLASIADILKSHHQAITKENVVSEYLDHKDIYSVVNTHTTPVATPPDTIEEYEPLSCRRADNEK